MRLMCSAFNNVGPGERIQRRNLYMTAVGFIHQLLAKYALGEKCFWYYSKMFNGFV
jgi:hypothetical protein